LCTDYDIVLLLLKVHAEVDSAAESRQFSSVQTPVDMFDSISAESHVLDYTRLPMTDDAAPIETVRHSFHCFAFDLRV